MSAHPSIETLRELVTRDQAFFKAQSQRLSEIQESDPNTLSDADKNALSNWDKSVVTDCNRQLLLLEEIEQPSADERAVMKELHNLITLGDHIMEKRNLVRAELNDRLNALKKSKAAKSVSTGSEKTVPVATRPHVHFADTDEASNTVKTTPSYPTHKAIPSPSSHTPSPPTPADTHSNDVVVAATYDSNETEVIDPKILYNILKVEPDASLVDIKKYDPSVNIIP
jgi:hypothetical protein